jgi:hypothetical protein
MTTVRLNLLLALAAFALLTALPATVRADRDGVRLEAILTASDADPDAFARAEFRDQGRGRLRLDVEVEDVASTDMVVVLINGTPVAAIALDENGDGQIDLETQRGDTVPAISAGDVITIADADSGTLLLQGTFAPRQ